MRFSSENMLLLSRKMFGMKLVYVLCEIEAVIALAVGRFARISSIAFPK